MQCDDGSNLSKQRTVEGVLPAAAGSRTSAKHPTFPFKTQEVFLFTEYSCNIPLAALLLTALNRHHCMFAETEYSERV
jgi:hypothetical protein